MLKLDTHESCCLHTGLKQIEEKVDSKTTKKASSVVQGLLAYISTWGCIVGMVSNMHKADLMNEI